VVRSPWSEVEAGRGDSPAWYDARPPVSDELLSPANVRFLRSSDLLPGAFESQMTNSVSATLVIASSPRRNVSLPLSNDRDPTLSRSPSPLVSRYSFLTVPSSPCPKVSRSHRPTVSLSPLPTASPSESQRTQWRVTRPLAPLDFAHRASRDPVGAPAMRDLRLTPPRHLNELRRGLAVTQSHESVTPENSTPAKAGMSAALRLLDNR
jgi:hypothetical protein